MKDLLRDWQPFKAQTAGENWLVKTLLTSERIFECLCWMGFQDFHVRGENMAMLGSIYWTKDCAFMKIV